MESQHLANTSWAFATVRLQHETWFKGLPQELLSRSQVRRPLRLPPRHLVNILWGFARVGMTHQRLLALFREGLSEIDLSHWNGRDLSGVVWAFASLETIHVPLFNAIAAESRKLGRLSDFGPQELQNLAWAFAIASRSGLSKADDLASLEDSALQELPLDLTEALPLPSRRKHGSTSLDPGASAVSAGKPRMELRVSAVSSDEDAIVAQKLQERQAFGNAGSWRVGDTSSRLQMKRAQRC
eukprot:TRINITY_DN9286_c0_g1_i10.p1 TRINITY_DN9286_c0_g1~~TRINITY_DN9286_c0_g1_i10.p1  ORF type:complete len:248 (-),score=30.76 TRINITY_DN9286_c0_g1_i10:195-917(-)